ncbi:IclR family transcriptional regulator [Nocardia sp. NPDC004711]
MNSVLTTLRVFEEVAVHQPIGLTGLAQRLEIPKSTVQRCLKTLAQAGWTRPADDGSGRWVITGKAFSLGSAVALGQHLREVALPVLGRLQEQTGETIHLTVPDGDEMLLIERLDSAHHLRAFLPLGTRLPFHAAANGKSYLATLDTAKIDSLLAPHLNPVTAQTITDIPSLLDELEIIRQRGYAVSTGELNDGISAVAVAVQSRTGSTSGCFSISGPSSRLTPERYEEYGSLALAAKREIERVLS